MVNSKWVPIRFRNQLRPQRRPPLSPTPALEKVEDLLRGPYRERQDRKSSNAGVSPCPSGAMLASRALRTDCEGFSRSTRKPHPKGSSECERLFAIGLDCSMRQNGV